MDFKEIFSELRIGKATPSPENTQKIKDRFNTIHKGLLSKQSQAIILNLVQNLTGRVVIFDQDDIHEATLLFQKIQILDQFLRKHRGANPDLIKKIVDLTFPLMDGCDCKASQTILETCLRFSEDDIESLAVLGPPLMKGLRDPEQKMSLIHAIQALPLKSREAICTEAIPLISTPIHGFYRIQILRKLEGIHEETRPFICKTLLKLIEGAGGKEIIDIIDTLNKLDSKALDIINVRSFEFAEKLTSGTDRCSVIHEILKEFETRTSDLPVDVGMFIKTFSTKDLDEFIPHLKNLLNKLPQEQHFYVVMMITHSIPPIPTERIALFCQKVLSCISPAFTPPNILSLIQIMKAIPTERIDLFCKQVLSCISTAFTPEESLKLIRIMKGIPNDEREAFCQNANKPIIKTETPQIQLSLFRILKFFPPEHHSTLLREIIDELRESSDEMAIILKILNRHPELKDPVHSYLLVKLKKEDIPQDDRHELADCLAKSLQSFQLTRADPLFVEAVIFIGESFEPSHPYAVFKKVNDSAKLDTPSAPLQDGIKLCPKQIFADARPFIPQSEVLAITQGAPVNGQVLQNFISTFRERVREAPNKTAIEALVIASNEASLAELLENLEDPFFSELLNKPFQDPIPLKQAVICSLIRFFSDLSNEVPEGALLSPREEALCKASSSIKNCAQGKSEGLILVYTYFLPENYCYHIESDIDIDIVAKAKAFVRTTLQNTIMNQLSSDSPMMRAMTESDGQVEQISHQSTYVKNLLAPHMGMAHSLEFDEHTATLYTSLLEKSLQEIFTLFYTHFTVKSAIESLQKAFSQLPQTTKRPIYNGIVELLAPRIGSHNIFNLDEETGEILSLQDNAAKELLLALGIGELA